jgi:hypothetical protein
MTTALSNLYYNRAGRLLIYGDHSNQPHGFTHWSEEAEADLIERGYVKDAIPPMRQAAPWPELLAEVVAALDYRPGWTFRLEDVARDTVDAADRTSAELAGGLTFIVRTKGYDSYHPEQGENYAVLHYFIVPAATYNLHNWGRWVFERILDVERHEAMEFFKVNGIRPYAPNHGPGEDPYVVREVTTDEARRTRFTGKVVDAPTADA